MFYCRLGGAKSVSSSANSAAILWVFHRLSWFSAHTARLEITKPIAHGRKGWRTFYGKHVVISNWCWLKPFGEADRAQLRPVSAWLLAVLVACEVVLMLGLGILIVAMSADNFFCSYGYLWFCHLCLCQSTPVITRQMLLNLIFHELCLIQILLVQQLTSWSWSHNQCNKKFTGRHDRLVVQISVEVR